MDYTYLAKVLNIHDGDTIKVSIRLKASRVKPVDLGFHIHVEEGWLCLHTNIRFLGINAPELKTPEGKDSLTYLKTLLAVGDIVRIKSYPDKTIDADKYGDRWDAIVVTKDGVNVNEQMLSAGMAVPMPGGHT